MASGESDTQRLEVREAEAWFEHVSRFATSARALTFRLNVYNTKRERAHVQTSFRFLKFASLPRTSALIGGGRTILAVNAATLSDGSPVSVGTLFRGRGQLSQRREGRNTKDQKK